MQGTPESHPWTLRLRVRESQCHLNSHTNVVGNSYLQILSVGFGKFQFKERYNLSAIHSVTNCITELDEKKVQLKIISIFYQNIYTDDKSLKLGTWGA